MPLQEIGKMLDVITKEAKADKDSNNTTNTNSHNNDNNAINNNHNADHNSSDDIDIDITEALKRVLEYGVRGCGFLLKSTGANGRKRFSPKTYRKPVLFLRKSPKVSGKSSRRRPRRTRTQGEPLV